MTVTKVALTEEQRQIAEAPVAARIVVIAAAGTGKTEVVAQRLKWMLRTEDVAPASELLVLSFSRSAVGEVKRRIRLDDPRLAATRVVTFDSFATRLLATYASDDEWTLERYDGRIRLATHLLAADPEARAEIGDFRHLVVDEMQDVVGDRADFVDTILLALSPDAGFTLLADPAQGVYDFQLAVSESKQTGGRLLREILSRAPTPCVRLLSSSFRARTKAAAAAALNGEMLRVRALRSDPAPDSDRELRTDLLRLHSFSVSAAGAIITKTVIEGGTAAVLCRYRSQALMVSRSFRDHGTAHQLQSSSDDRPIAAWVANVMRGCVDPQMSPSTFLQVAERVVPGSDPDALWQALKRAEGRNGPDLNIRTLATRIANRPFDDLIEQPSDRAVVSSIHRAKGLEWDVVFLCGLESPGEDPFEDARLIYVGMTRGREELYSVKAPEGQGLRSRDQLMQRWVRTNPASGQATQMEIFAGDVQWVYPAGVSFLDDIATDIQDYLAQRLRRGDDVELVLLRSVVEGVPRAIYRIDHHGRAIGVTASQLSDAILKNGARRRSGRLAFPSRLLGARVEGVETVVGSSAAGFRAGLGSAGMWLRPRIGGLADVDWRGDGR